MITRTKFDILRTAPYDNENSLIGWWSFDDGRATDFSGNQNNGVATGSPVFATSDAGNSFKFSAGNYFQVSTLGNSNPITTNALTVSCWLVPNVTTFSTMMSVWANGGASSDQFDLVYGLTSGKPEFFVQFAAGGAPSSGVGATVMTVGVRYHVVGTFDGTNVSVYLNGILESTVVSAGVLGTGISNLVQIGASAGANALDGTLADVRLYNRALSRQEINDLYNHGVTRFSTSPDEWIIPAVYAGVTGATNLMSQIWM